jgi:hypothetical protein
MSKIKVFLGIMSTGLRADIHPYIFDKLRTDYADSVELVFPDKCARYFGHDFARNEYVERFLDSDCDVLWFLDSDVIPPPHIFDLLTIHANKNWLAAGAPYPLWLPLRGSGEMGVVFTSYKGNAPDERGVHGLVMSDCPKTGTEWVDGLATGCLFLRRELFSKLEKPYFQFKRKHENQEVLEGEDLGFALKLQKLGIKYFCDHGMVCGHEKSVNLIEVNNYAISLANSKVLSYHQEVEGVLRDAVKKAAAEGYRKGKSDALSGAVPQKNKSGLILPSQL